MTGPSPGGTAEMGRVDSEGRFRGCRASRTFELAPGPGQGRRRLHASTPRLSKGGQRTWLQGRHGARLAGCGPSTATCLCCHGGSVDDGRVLLARPASGMGAPSSLLAWAGHQATPGSGSPGLALGGVVVGVLEGTSELRRGACCTRGVEPGRAAGGRGLRVHGIVWASAWASRVPLGGGKRRPARPGRAVLWPSGASPFPTA